ncbi:integral membrane protein [Lasius niger]|uniref:Integral membrane protein n=1 Tax=Lasius niger TaxID=67767 RepID=A0A0J7MYE5_LASNI|nr:integral membrane protein [Lasius niger]
MTQMRLFGGSWHSWVLQSRQMGAELGDQDRSRSGDRSGELGELGEAAFAVVRFDRLLQGGDVSKRQQEQDHEVSFVFYGRYLQQQP